MRIAMTAPQSACASTHMTKDPGQVELMYTRDARAPLKNSARVVLALSLGFTPLLLAFLLPLHDRPVRPLLSLWAVSGTLGTALAIQMCIRVFIFKSEGRRMALRSLAIALGSLALCRCAFAGANQVERWAADREGRIACAANLKTIYQALSAYAADHNGRFPDKLSDLVHDVTFLYLICPSADVDIAHGSLQEQSESLDAQPSYLYLGAGHRAGEASQFPLILDRPANHGSGGGNVLWSDGRIEWRSATALRKSIEGARVP
jgi:hypothetical protein